MVYLKYKPSYNLVLSKAVLELDPIQCTVLCSATYSTILVFKKGSLVVGVVLNCLRASFLSLKENPLVYKMLIHVYFCAPRMMTKKLAYCSGNNISQKLTSYSRCPKGQPDIKSSSLSM